MFVFIAFKGIINTYLHAVSYLILNYLILKLFNNKYLLLLKLKT